MNCIRVHQEPLWCKKSFIGFFHSGKPSSSCGSAWFWGCGWGQDASHQALPAEQSGGMLPELSSSFPGEHFKCPSPGGVKDAPFIWPKSKDGGSHYFCFHFYFVLFGLIFTLLFVIIQASRPENNPHNQILICTSTKTPLHPEPARSSSCRGKWWWDIVTGHKTKTAQWQKAIPLVKSWTVLPVSQLQLASNVQHPDLGQLQHNNRNARYNLLLGIKISPILIGFILTVHPSV